MHRIAIIGAGAIGSAMAAYLNQRGYCVSIWSRSLINSPRVHAEKLHIRTTGVFESSFEIEVLKSLAQLSDYDVVIIAIPATAYFDLLPELACHLTSQHNVIFSSSLSLAPLWLYEMAQEAGSNPVVSAWGTTLLAASFQPDQSLYIPFIRKTFGIASLPESATPQSVSLCHKLFGIEFSPARSVLDINLSNINPIAHAGQLLINFSRIDKSETWKLFENFTDSGIRIAEALDAERLTLAAAFGSKPRSLRSHYALSYPVKDAIIADMVHQISESGSRTLGPKTLTHRYIVEDMPYGLAFLERLAHSAKVNVPMINAVITVLETMTGMKIRESNRIINAVLAQNETKNSIFHRCNK